MNKEIILIIEDEEKILEVICSYLEHEGYLPVPAGTGNEGLNLFKTENPSLVILDLMLPDMSGEEICRIIRRKLRGQTAICFQ